MAAVGMAARGAAATAEWAAAGSAREAEGWARAALVVKGREEAARVAGETLTAAAVRGRVEVARARAVRAAEETRARVEAAMVRGAVAMALAAVARAGRRGRR